MLFTTLLSVVFDEMEFGYNKIHLHYYVQTFEYFIGTNIHLVCNT